MLVSLDGTRKKITVYLRDSLILQEKILCHIGYIRICSGLPALITASREWPLRVIVQFSMKLLRRSVQNQRICNHPYDEITSYLFFFFTNNAAFRRTLGIFRIHPQRQNTLLKEKDLCWFTLKNVLQEGQSRAAWWWWQTGKKRGKMCSVENGV